MKGKIMTEVTTTEPQLSKFDLLKQEANNKIASMTLDDIAGYIAQLRVNNEEARNATSAVRGRLQQFVDSATEFLKEHIKDGADSDELKEFAEELEIELTKEVSVKFTVDYEATLTVPFDYDIDSITDGDFDVSIRFTSREDDVELENDSAEVEDFEVEEA